MRFLFLRAGLLMFALGFTGLKDPYDLLACVADCVASVWRGRGRALSLLRRDSSWVSMKIAIIFLSPSLLVTQRGLCGGERIGVEGALRWLFNSVSVSTNPALTTFTWPLPQKKYRVFCIGENREHIDCGVWGFLLHSIHTTLPLATSWLCLSSLKIESKVSWK